MPKYDKIIMVVIFSLILIGGILNRSLFKVNSDNSTIFLVVWFIPLLGLVILETVFRSRIKKLDKRLNDICEDLKDSVKEEKRKPIIEKPIPYKDWMLIQDVIKKVNEPREKYNGIWDSTTGEIRFRNGGLVRNVPYDVNIGALPGIVD